MSKIETLIAQIIERKHRLDNLKAQSPEIAEALALSDEYHGLLNDLREMCNPTPAQVVPAPYVVYPAYPFWQSPAVYTADNTVMVSNPTVCNPSGSVTLLEPRYYPPYQITWTADVPPGSTLQIVK